MSWKEKILKNTRAAYTLGASTILSRYTIGTNIYDHEWDLLIILDACRVDAMKKVASEYDFIQDVGAMWSVGSTSKEWIDRTFVNSYQRLVRDTAYVTANPFCENLLNYERTTHKYLEFSDTLIEKHPKLATVIRDGLCRQESFGLLDGIWESSNGDTDFGRSQHPENVTDHAIWVGRNTDFSRQIVHYMQPHVPYFTTGDNYESLTDVEKHPFKHLKNGAHDRSEVFDLYLENLRYVLDHVERLLNNIDAETVALTADHGELFGEWGLYSHHACVLHPALRKVPWVKTTANDSQTYNPPIERSDVEQVERISDEKLAALGYLETD